jgi:hypothetical protein
MYVTVCRESRERDANFIMRRLVRAPKGAGQGRCGLRAV